MCWWVLNAELFQTLYNLNIQTWLSDYNISDCMKKGMYKTYKKRAIVSNMIFKSEYSYELGFCINKIVQKKYNLNLSSTTLKSTASKKHLSTFRMCGVVRDKSKHV